MWVAAPLALALAIGAAQGAELARATTAPQGVRLDSVVLGPKTIKLTFTQLPRGALVVFKVHNASGHPAGFIIRPGTLEPSPAQGGTGGFRTKVLPPGGFASFQIEFQLRGSFTFAAFDKAGKERLNGKFLVT